MWKAKGGNMFRRRKHSMPVLNTTSTADISFMLLIFFLVTTSMDIDKGLSRQLPPLDDEKEEQVIDMDKSNMIRLAISADNQLSINDSLVTLQQVRQQVMDFVEHCPDRKQHVVSVEVAREANYNTYFNMQNEIVAAYYYQGGSIANTLQYDKQMKAAEEILLDTERYNKILKPEVKG